jgi:biotin carboxyl carrier protein
MRIVVMVERERFEVWPEAEAPQAPCAETMESWAEPATAAPTGTARAQPGVQGAGRGAGGKLRAPIPGVVEPIAVRAGDRVSPGGPLCVIEAMKMKNTIRASRPGTSDDVLVTKGQHVRHNDVLLEFGN